jgi:hypothetical protein
MLATDSPYQVVANTLQLLSGLQRHLPHDTAPHRTGGGGLCKGGLDLTYRLV